MAGILKGSVNHKIGLFGGSDWRGTQEHFTIVHNFLNSKFTRIAYNRGTSGSVGTVGGFWDVIPAFGNNAWAVFIAANAVNPFYIFLQWGDGSMTNGGGAYFSSGSLLVGVAANSGVGIAIGQRSDGGNPWNGTSNNDGVDTKGTPVWTGGVSNLQVWPRSNGVGGDYATNKNNCMGLGFTTNELGKGSRVHMVADDDNFVIATNSVHSLNPINMDYNNFFYFGKYLPRPSLTGSMLSSSYVCFHERSSLPGNSGFQTGPANIYGTTNSSQSNYNDGGGVCHPTGSYGVLGVSTDVLPLFFQRFFQPNTFSSTVQFDIFNLPVFLNEGSVKGYLGDITFIKTLGGVPTHWTTTGYDWAVIGLSDRSQRKWLIPWGITKNPSEAINRNGVQF